MQERSIDDTLLLDIIESGEIKHKDETHLWIFKAYQSRNDNLVCLAVVLEASLVVKTVMHHFQIKDAS